MSQARAASDFTVCVLLYGDYPDLARRCLSGISILARSGLISLRIGMNSVSNATEDVVAAMGLRECVFAQSRENIKKYPMMRRLFSAPEATDPYDVCLTSEFVMWFDDDSYITATSPCTWLGRIRQAMTTVDMLGSIHTISLKGGQAEWIKTQPWYAGTRIAPWHRVSFCTGGWWTIRADILQRFQWPIPELLHRGGDVMLGALCHEHGFRKSHYREGIAINADDQGRESRSPRRGYDSHPIGWDYVGER
jgi:hypothetical protein